MVNLVVTTGSGSLDIYSQNLAKSLDVTKIYTDIYQGNAELFNISFFDRRAAGAAYRDCYFIRVLRRTNGIIHLPNHHLGRYGLFLKKPYIITVHDLIRYIDLKGNNGSLIHRPNFRDRVYLSLDYKGIKKATHIIAVSRATRDALIEHIGIPEERISVVYEGIDHSLFRPVERRPIDDPYLLCVGTEQPRKNIIGLLRAFSKLKNNGSFKDLKLVKVGEPGVPEFRRATLRAIEESGLSDEVILTGYVADEDLPTYYSGAECFVLPSLYEGFGLPPLEAMACGCPVIVSNVTSLPEIVGDAALLVNPHSADELARAIESILTNGRLKEGLVTRGLKHAGKFSWEKTATETEKVYEAVECSIGHDYVPTAN